MKTDQSSVIKILPSIDPAVIYAANGTKTGAIINAAGYESLTFGIQTGVVTDGTLTSAIYGSADSGMAGEVQLTGNQLIGTDPSFAITDDSAVKRVGVNLAACPTYQYFRQKVTQAAASTGGYVCGHAVLGNPRFAPVS